jgi:hypothetical protein
LSAATELARAGLPVLVVDQALALGGAVHRQPLPDVRSVASPAQKKRWGKVITDMKAQGDRITVSLSTRFCGLDHTGAVLLGGARNALIRPRALVLALGAREVVQPRPGWTLAGVETVGSLQTRLKTLGEAPEGRILLAGSGPLLLALGAELVKRGNPPVAILEAGYPFNHPLHSLRLPFSYWTEACQYITRLRLAGVPVLTGAHLSAIHGEEGNLRAEVETPKGKKQFVVRHIGLHDGIRPNDIGLPDCAALPVIHVGDCREAVGARAAVADGRSGGAALAARLLAQPAPAPDPEISRQRDAQARLALIYAHTGASRLEDMPDDTVICRCEARTIDDLRALGTAPTPRQLRLDGRFAMGPCQGRFCADWVNHLTKTTPPRSGIGAPRWPARPISVADLLAAPDDTEGDIT